ncbi:MAG: cell envelope integrity protein TolA [Myxococcota bacterium]
MSADLVGWQDEQALDHRRRLRNAMLVSLAIHGLMVGAFAFSPSPEHADFPEVLAVDLIGPSLAAPKSAPSAPPRASAPKPPAPAPPPEAAEPPPPAPPAPKAPVQVLPEESPSKVAKVQPKPKAEPKPKARPKPAPKPRPKRTTPEKELSHDDALAALMDELGGDDVSESLQRAPAKEEPAEPATSSGTPGTSGGQDGVKMASDLARWKIAMERRVKRTWIALPQHRGQGLATQLEIRISAAGDLLGEPKVVGSSGDPNFDDSAVRGVMKATPLPPPPRSGPVRFVFRSESE